MQAYDFTALSKAANPNPLASVEQDAANTKKHRLPKLVVLAAVAGVLAICLYVAIIAGTQATKVVSSGELIAAISFGFINVVMTIGFVAAIAALVMYGMRLGKQRLARISQFAAKNGLVFCQNFEPISLKGMIFDDGRNRKVKESLLFPDGIELANYSFVTGSGKNRQTHNFGYVRVALNKALPNMVLDAKHNNFLGMTNLPDVFHSSQKLQLEGDFNNYFNLYAPKQYERDALYVFTPDVMQALTDSGRKYDIEIVDNELFMYQPVFIDLSSETALREVLAATDIIATELRDQTKRYSDERAQNTGGMQVVAEPGRRLKKGVNWIVVLIVSGVIGMNLILTFAPSEVSAALSVGFGFVFWAVVIFAVLRHHQRR